MVTLIDTRTGKYLATRKDLIGKSVNLTEVSAEGDIPLGWWVWDGQRQTHTRKTLLILQGEGKSLIEIREFVATLEVVKAATKVIERAIAPKSDKA